jgi:hypothetical protein
MHFSDAKETKVYDKLSTIEAICSTVSDWLLRVCDQSILELT